MGLGFPSGSFRPGKVVWAKVDGHEWWPAKVCFCCLCTAQLRSDRMTAWSPNDSHMTLESLRQSHFIVRGHHAG